MARGDNGDAPGDENHHHRRQHGQGCKGYGGGAKGEPIEDSERAKQPYGYDDGEKRRLIGYQLSGKGPPAPAQHEVYSQRP